jgi:PAS domain S-box-containing protein
MDAEDRHAYEVESQPIKVGQPSKQGAIEQPLEETCVHLKERLDKQLSMLKQQIARRKQVENALRHESASLRLIQQIALIASELSSTEEVFHFTLRSICEYTNCPCGHAYILSLKGEDKPSSYIWYCSDEDRFSFLKEQLRGSKFIPKSALMRSVIERGGPMWVQEIDRIADQDLTQILLEVGIQSSLAFPVVVASEVVAAIQLFSLDGAEPDTSVMEVIDSVGKQLAYLVERTRAKESLQRSQSLLSQSQQLARLGSWEWDLSNNRFTWSDELFRIFGVDQQGFDGSYDSFLELVHPDDRNFVHETLQNTLHSKTPLALYQRVLHPDGRERTLLGIGRPVLSEAGELLTVIGTYQDVSDQKEVEAKLVRQAQKLAALNKMGQTVTITSDVELIFQRILFTLRPILDAEAVFILLLEGDELAFVAVDNEQGSHLEGLRIPATAGVAGEIIAKGKPILLYGEEIKRHISMKFMQAYGHPIQALMAVPLRVQDEWVGVMEAVHSQEDAFTRDDMQLMESAASWVAATIQNSRLFSQAEANRQRLGQLARKVVTAQEEERLRISRELHDEAGQALIVLKLNLESVLAEVPAESKSIRRQLIETISLTDQTMEQIRIIAHDLRPQVLESFGLNSALEGLCNDFAIRSKLPIQYKGTDFPHISDPIAISFYRFLQESLTNIIKHAHASQVEVDLSLDQNSICLSVSDNGIGVSRDAESDLLRRSPGLGLRGLQERFELLGGWVLIDSSSSEGTRVSAYVPAELSMEVKE